jgi:hypothetical protein
MQTAINPKVSTGAPTFNTPEQSSSWNPDNLTCNDIEKALMRSNFMGMPSYKVTPENRDDGTQKALLIVIDFDGTERPLVRYQTVAEAEAARKFLEKQHDEESVGA